MDNLEKILFIDLTCKQFDKIDTDHPEFISTWKRLTEKEKTEYSLLTNEIHEIWSYINMPIIIDLGNKRVNSVFEYNELIHPVNNKILKFCRDFEISLKEELTDNFKKAAKRSLGQDYFKWFEE